MMNALLVARREKGEKASDVCLYLKVLQFRHGIRYYKVPDVTTEYNVVFCATDHVICG